MTEEEANHLRPEYAELREAYTRLKKAYQRDWRSKAPPVLEEPSWEALERDHPRWNLELSFSDFTDKSHPF